MRQQAGGAGPLLFGRPVGYVLLLCVVSWGAATGILAPGGARGQFMRGAYPRDDYYLAKSIYDDGDYAAAVKAFRNVAKSGVRSTEGRWVDSICYYAMTGECLYRLGDPGGALDQYSNALKVLLANQQWMQRVDFPAGIEPSQRRPKRPINWGLTTRRTIVGRFPETMPTLQGRFDNLRVIQQGGVVATPQLFSLRVGEIVRCTALAIRRRHEIMGPTSKHDALTEQVVDALARRPAPANHWSQAWIGVPLGLAYAADGQAAQAMSELQSSLQVAGQFDHPLTATALLELGKQAFEQEQYKSAASFFLEASMAAAVFEQYDLTEEALRWGAVTHLIAGEQGIYPPLAAATVWARRDSAPLETSLLLSAAEGFAARRETARAGSLLDEAQRAMRRTQLSASTMGARYEYLSAAVNLQRGNVTAGTASLNKFLAFQKTSSLRLMQISLVDSLYTSGSIREDRLISSLFDDVLREPTAKDWLADPMETLTVVATPLLPPMEHWLEHTMKRREHEKALEIIDRIRRRRFYGTLPMGGRLLSLRWILEAPSEAITDRALLERQDMLAKYPGYANLQRQAAAVRAQLDSLPLFSDDAAKTSQQLELLGQLSKVSNAEEATLHSIALSREPSEFVFPPLLDVASLRERLRPRQLVLAFFATRNALYGYAMGRENYAQWRIDSPQKLRQDAMEMLRLMGNYDRNHPIGPDELNDNSWQEPGKRLLEQLSNNARADAWSNFDELVIVPDGFLWYVPFEALPVVEGDAASPLISKVRIRYAPTVSLVVPDGRGVKPTARTAIVLGKLFPRDPDELVSSTVERLEAVDPRVVTVNNKLAAPGNLFASTCDRLVVLADMDNSRAGPYDWAPLQLDSGKPGSALSSWFSLPWGGPQQVVLPGFHSSAEDALKRGGSGDEVFLSVCGLMSTGTRTMLLSRWRVGGQTSYDLVREFVQELPHSSAAQSWQRSVLLNMDSDVDPSRESRVNLGDMPGGLKANHPFFWSGYMLVDTGWAQKENAPAPR